MSWQRQQDYSQQSQYPSQQQHHQSQQGRMGQQSNVYDQLQMDPPMHLQQQSQRMYQQSQQHYQQSQYQQQQNASPYGHGYGSQAHQSSQYQQHFGAGSNDGYVPPPSQYQQYGGQGGGGPLRGGGAPASYGASYPHSTMNVHAQPFTPRYQPPAMSQQQQYGQQDQQMMYPPPYANAPMYGLDSESERLRYTEHLTQQQPSMQQQQPQMGQQQQPYYATEDEYAAAYEAMYNQSGEVRYVPSAVLYEKMRVSQNAMLLNEIQVGLEQLITEQEQFDTWSSAILERMNERNMKDEGRHIALEIILEMAMGISPLQISGNPQLAFAKLVAYLSMMSSTLMRSTILPVLQETHSKRVSLPVDQKCNLLSFFAELFERVEATPGQRIKNIGKALMDQIDDILKSSAQATEQEIKQVIQVFKLCGRDLDAIELSRVNDLLTSLTAFRGHPQLSESVKTQITSLMELRQLGWGYRNVTTSTSSAPAGSIIGADGAALDLSEEERTFLEQHFGALEGKHRDSTENDSSIDDQEIEADYGKFMEEEEASRKQKEQADAALAAQMDAMAVGEAEESTPTNETNPIGVVEPVTPEADAPAVAPGDKEPSASETIPTDPTTSA